MAATHYFHKITIPGRASRYSAWFEGDPHASRLATLVDAERIDARGRSYRVTPLEEAMLMVGEFTALQSGTFDA